MIIKTIKYYEDIITDFKDDKNEYLSKSFNDLNLVSIEFCSKNFESCIFKECDFGEAIFNECSFIDCHFLKCNLSLIKIKRSKFSDVIFDECKIIGVDWTKASWPSFALCSPIKFHKCIVNDSSFFGLSLSEIVIEECKANYVDFRAGNFSEANFKFTDFANSLFSKTNLTGADFTEAINYHIDIYLNEIKRAKFCRSEALSLLDSLGIELID